MARGWGERGWLVCMALFIVCWTLSLCCIPVEICVRKERESDCLGVDLVKTAKAGIFAFVFLALAGCSLPRGAGIDREILAEANAQDPSFSVVPVTRARLRQIRDWPATGATAGYRWPQAHGGPVSSVLKAGDRIDLVIWDSQDVSLLASAGERSTAIGGLVVEADGSIFVPYVGDVVVVGLTPAQAREDIQGRLSSIAPSAQVQLAVSAGQANTADVVSGVAKPGRFALRGRNETILSLIAEAGGISAALKNPLVRLIRGGQSYQIRADALFENATRNITVRGADKVIVEEDKRFFVGLGATGSEEIVYFDRERITALEALSMLGGLTDTRANPEGVLILREYPESAIRSSGGQGPEMRDIIFTFDLTTADGLFAARNFRVFANDTVIATESPLNAATSVIGLVASLFSVGKNL